MNKRQRKKQAKKNRPKLIYSHLLATLEYERNWIEHKVLEKSFNSLFDGQEGIEVTIKGPKVFS